MPKLKTERDPWASWRGMVLEAKQRLGLTLDDIADRLKSRAVGLRRAPSRQMVSRWIDSPDEMPLWAFARINRILEIEAEEARKAAVVWR